VIVLKKEKKVLGSSVFGSSVLGSSVLGSSVLVSSVVISSVYFFLFLGHIFFFFPQDFKIISDFIKIHFNYSNYSTPT
jgi:hypothetical protein